MNGIIKRFFIFFLAGLFAGCNTSSGAGAEGNKAIVKINGTVYTAGDLWNFANATLWEMEPKDLTNDKVRDQLLNDFIEHRLLVAEAARRNIAPDKNKLSPFFERIASPKGTKELKATTGHFGIDAGKTARLISERLVIDDLFRTLLISAGYVSEGELKKYYETQKTPEVPAHRAHILHIFTTDNDSAQQAAKELASGILFQEVARKYSEAAEKTRGGDLGFINQSEYPEFFSTAFRLKEGETSPVIQSDYGYHIFRMVQYARASRNSYENMKTFLLAELYTQKRQDTIGEFINALYSNADVQYLNHFTLSELLPPKR